MCTVHVALLCGLYLTFVRIQLSLRVQEDDVQDLSLPNLEQGIMFRFDVVGEYSGH